MSRALQAWLIGVRVTGDRPNAVATRITLEFEARNRSLAELAEGYGVSKLMIKQDREQ